VSSDELHALAYIPQEYAPLLPKTEIAARAEQITTEAGFACTPEKIGAKLTDQYHGYKVWPFEQALIHYGSKKFGIDMLADVATRCVPYINQGQELLAVKPEIKPEGNDLQVWSRAADIYFSDAPSLRQVDWL
jgi:glycogen debranching enzyme